MRPWSSVVIPALPGKSASLSLWNAASQKVEPTRVVDGKASLYVCGITPYDSTHMGHATTYVTFDLVHRLLIDAGHEVNYVQNVTDIDDPLLERALKLNQSWESIAAKEVTRFKDDMVALRVLAPQSYVQVTEHMTRIVEWISRLVDANLAYVVECDVYFDISGSQALGDVSHFSEAEMLELFAQRGGDPDREGKRNQLDPLLWRGKREGEPSWSAPFGDGRPGWHIECVAIAADLAGRPITVQGGGRDLVFPHHEMCNVQSLSLDGIPFASTFAHAGMVHYQGEKMSKSLGNLVFISEMVSAGADPMAIRLAIIASHYRSDWEWTDERMRIAERRLETWRRALAMQAGADGASLLSGLRHSLANDLDTPATLSLIDAWAHDTLAGNTEDETAQGLVSRALDALLGITL